MALDQPTEALLRFAADPEHGQITCFDDAQASPERLDTLLDGEVRWNSNRSGLDLRGRNLQDASLRSADLSSADLSKADLSRGACAGMSLREARLEGATLTEVDLVGADLSGVSGDEADFTGGLMEDARVSDGHLRFSNFTDAILEGADFKGADLWAARMPRVAAERAIFRDAKLDESNFTEADLSLVDFVGASLRRANLTRTTLRDANFEGAKLEGADLSGANLSGAILANVSLSSCKLKQAKFAGAWLERTRMTARQVTEGVGEELAGDFEAAIDSYIVLERNFESLGISQDASWAYLRRRRVGRRLHAQRAREAYKRGEKKSAANSAARWFGDAAAEWLCDYGESLWRVARAFITIMLFFSLVYFVTHSLEPRPGFLHARLWAPVNYLLFSLDSMTTVGTSEVALVPRTELGILLSSLQTVIGTILLGLFGFVLGARIRS